MIPSLFRHRDRVLCWPLPLRWAAFILVWGALSGSGTLLCALVLHHI